MRILIIGGGGMLGHQLWQVLVPQHDVWVTLRSQRSDYARYGLFAEDRTLEHCNVLDRDNLARAFAQCRPEVVINCVGIIKQVPAAKDHLASLEINSMLPHRLADLCRLGGARLVHISTDCVFSGRKGPYRESEITDAEDLYGRTKALGEVSGAPAITLRTSIVGRELKTRHGLLEWFLSQEGKEIQGFERALYTGFTTLELSRIIARVIERHTELHGLWHVSSEAISKHELLSLAKKSFKWQGSIIPSGELVCDRRLDSSRFRRVTGYTPPSWQEMLDEMACAGLVREVRRPA